MSTASLRHWYVSTGLLADSVRTRLKGLPWLGLPDGGSTVTLWMTGGSLTDRTAALDSMSPTEFTM